MKCILCESVQVYIKGKVFGGFIVKGWSESFGIDVREGVSDDANVNIFLCEDCGLEFFSPDLAGSGFIYEKLSEHSWYYMKNKWEHITALQDMLPGQRVLEVGCGKGDFVQQMQNAGMIAEGSEYNAAAVTVAQENGLPVSGVSLDELVVSQTEKFDVVCCFHVLEHVADPRGFIDNCLKLLKPDGKFIVAVPNNESFIKYAPLALLNMPPHHITRWREQSLRNIVSVFELNIEQIVKESLADYHLEWYVNLMVQRFLLDRRLIWRTKPFFRKLTLFIFRKFKLQRYVIGQTIYVCYRKN